MGSDTYCKACGSTLYSSSCDVCAQHYECVPTLRDQFAMAAPSQVKLEFIQEYCATQEAAAREDAEWRYIHADAMLAARAAAGEGERSNSE